MQPKYLFIFNTASAFTMNPNIKWAIHILRFHDIHVYSMETDSDETT